MKLLEKFLNILYPRTCHFCGKISKAEICHECGKKIDYIEEPRCKKCGKPIRYNENEFCHDCRQNNFHYEQGKNVWLHKGKVKWSIYQFKYHNRRIYGKFYAKEMYRLYGEKLKEWEIDVIIPIPLHKKRKRKRGYNQAEILAKHLSELSGIPAECGVAERIHNTRPQKELSHNARKRNLQDAFRMKGVSHTWKNVLLIDDIYTTGNTIDSMARVLKEKGVDKVWFFTISIGQGF